MSSVAGGEQGPRPVRKTPRSPEASSLTVCTKGAKRPGNLVAQGNSEHKQAEYAVVPRGFKPGQAGRVPSRQGPLKPLCCDTSLPSRKHTSWLTFPNIQGDEPEGRVRRHLAFSALSRDFVEELRWLWKEQMQRLGS